ncbi:hypothetical protein BB558_005925, partial [Smittium angustum]
LRVLHVDNRLILIPDQDPGHENKKRKLENNSVKEEVKTIKEPVKKFKELTVGKKEKLSEMKYYSSLCEVLESVESTTKRLEITDIMSNFFKKMIDEGPETLTKCVYLCVNQVAPEYEGIELGVGESIVMKGIASSTGKQLSKVKSEAEKLGDLGTVAMNFRTNQKTLFPMPRLTIDKVFNTFYEISTSSGALSQQKKIDKISSLIVSGSSKEAKYIVRSLEGKLRIGLAEKTVLVALAQAAVFHKAESKGKKASSEELSKASEIIKTVYTQLPSYKILVESLLTHGIKNLQEFCKLVPGIPVKPMLAHPTKSITEVLDRFEGMEFTCEYKYDGERIQIHRLENGQVISFSRNSENTTEKYMDIMSKCDQFLKSGTKTFILDAEAVAWDKEKECILPFQVLSTRKRKDVKESEISVQVCVFVFDILYLNGESLLKKTFNERREIMKSAFISSPGQFEYAISKDLKSVDEIQAFLDESISGNCEGLMIKVLSGEESTYEPSKRSRNWLKVKKDYLDGIGDSLDLVVIGAYIGKGKRTGVYGGFLLACYDPEKEEYQSICKIGTGFSEASLEEFKNTLSAHVIPIPKPYYSYGDATKPDVWFEPVQVWEVKAADLSISPVYKAAIGYVNEEKGISLRFPRFIRLRTDKGPEQATSSEQVAEMFESQNFNSAS